MDESSFSIAVVGGGPAGLRAAEIAAAGGARVTVFDAKASVGRKFLVAGGGGLNLTKNEAVDRFATRYSGPEMPGNFWAGLIAEFAPEDLRAWAAGLGVETFVASTGRVYPREMKAAPLLRGWVQRLRRAGVGFAMHHRFVGWAENDDLEFATPEGTRIVKADATILALGGGSWPETGSDGGWVAALAVRGVMVAPLRSANCGWEVDWPAEVISMAGIPLKNIAVRAGGELAMGELMVTRHGFEGGAIYALGATLRGMEQPEVAIDFKPGLTAERLLARFGAVRKEWETTERFPPERWAALVGEASMRWRLGGAAAAILADAEPGGSVAELAARVKDFRVALRGPRPLAEAISSAGGVRWSELDEALMLRRMPGVFVAGEMIDWEAPTGGYLMQGAFATGMRAAQGALRWGRDV